MATLVLNNDSISVSLESDHLIIRQHNLEGLFETLPIKDVERVIVIGKPAITFPVLARFMDRRIPCTFLTKGERVRGVLDSFQERNADRRILQYDKLRDDAFCLRLAKASIRMKLQNCRRVIQRLCANRGCPISDMNEHWRELNACLAGVNDAGNADAVRGIEGIGAFHYFRLLSGFLPTAFKFESRSRRPPLDPANAVLSFLYTVLMNEVLAAVRLHALDPGLGFLHQDRSQSPSLALDLMESFRPAFADLLAMNLLSHGRLDADADFECDGNTGGVYLAKPARGRVLSACETALSRRFTLPGQTSRTTMRLVIDAQVVAFVRLLEKDTDMGFFKLP